MYSKLFLTLVCLVSLGLLCSADPSGIKCPAVDGAPNCVCKHPNGHIDLRPLANTNGTPRFSIGIVDAGGYNYSYNPCYPFNLKGGCGASPGPYSICQQITNRPGQVHVIADIASEQMMIDQDNTLYVYYTGPDNRETRVYLVCDQTAENGVVTSEGDLPTNRNYVFFLRSCHACVGGCKSDADKC